MTHESLTFDIMTSDGATIVMVAGEIDVMTSPQLAKTLEGLTGRVVVDLAAVSYLDSSGLHVLDGQHARLARDGAGIALRNPSDTVRRVLELTGFGALIEG